jgi:hypothetical protein
LAGNDTWKTMMIAYANATDRFEMVFGSLSGSPWEAVYDSTVDAAQACTNCIDNDTVAT